MEITDKQPEALRLADALDEGVYLLSVERNATAAELRRLHEVEQDHQILLHKHNALHVSARAHRDRIAALEQAGRMALENVCGVKLCEINSMSSRGEMARLMDNAIAHLRQALGEDA